MTDYVFHFKVTDADLSGRFPPRWAEAIPVAVLAPDRQTAYSRVSEMMGEKPRRGWEWWARLEKVEPSCCTKAGRA